jgi:hypothetical protein
MLYRCLFSGLAEVQLINGKGNVLSSPQADLTGSVQVGSSSDHALEEVHISTTAT